jgi:hypothetical protein
LRDQFARGCIIERFEFDCVNARGAIFAKDALDLLIPGCTGGKIDIGDAFVAIFTKVKIHSTPF